MKSQNFPPSAFPSLFTISYVNTYSLESEFGAHFSKQQQKKLTLKNMGQPTISNKIIAILVNDVHLVRKFDLEHIPLHLREYF